MAIRELNPNEVVAVSGGVAQMILGFAASYIASKAVDALYSAATTGDGSAGSGMISDTAAA